MPEHLVKVLFRIPESDRRALKILAAEHDTTTTELVRRLIRQYVTDKTDGRTELNQILTTTPVQP